MEIFSSLGVEWKLIVAQIINFGVLLFILSKLVYKPLLRVLDERSSAVKDAAEKSSSIEARLAEIKALEETTLAEARKRGAEIVKEAEAAGAVLRSKLEKEASESAAKVVREAEARMKAEHDKIQSELKSEIRNIVALALESTVSKYLDASAREKLTDEASKEALKIESFINTK